MHLLRFRVLGEPGAARNPCLALGCAAGSCIGRGGAGGRGVSLPGGRRCSRSVETAPAPNWHRLRRLCVHPQGRGRCAAAQPAPQHRAADGQRPAGVGGRLLSLRLPGAPESRGAGGRGGRGGLAGGGRLAGRWEGWLLANWQQEGLGEAANAMLTHRAPSPRACRPGCTTLFPRPACLPRTCTARCWREACAPRRATRRDWRSARVRARPLGRPPPLRCALAGPATVSPACALNAHAQPGTQRSLPSQDCMYCEPRAAAPPPPTPCPPPIPAQRACCG
jgi:hypothetical protein